MAIMLAIPLLAQSQAGAAISMIVCGRSNLCGGSAAADAGYARSA